MTWEKYKFNFSASDISRADMISITPARDKVERGHKDNPTILKDCFVLSPCMGHILSTLKLSFRRRGTIGCCLYTTVAGEGWAHCCWCSKLRTEGEEHLKQCLQSERADGAWGVGRLSRFLLQDPILASSQTHLEA